MRGGGGRVVVSASASGFSGCGFFRALPQHSGMTSEVFGVISTIEELLVVKLWHDWGVLETVFHYFSVR